MALHQIRAHPPSFTQNASSFIASLFFRRWQLRITGGNVYHGKKVPELVGSYLYADYVTGRIWALKYDQMAKRVTANKPIFGNIARSCRSVKTRMAKFIF